MSKKFTLADLKIERFPMLESYNLNDIKKHDDDINNFFEFLIKKNVFKKSEISKFDICQHKFISMFTSCVCEYCGINQRNLGEDNDTNN